MQTLEEYFKKFRDNIVGIDATFESPYGLQKVVYADWIASGRLYAPIEDKMLNLFGPMVGNTHSEASETGTSMTHAYHLAHKIIKQHVNANDNDIIITAGSGMTGVVNKLQRILGLKVPEQIHEFCKSKATHGPFCSNIAPQDRPVVFITHMEHHSNHTSWLETISDVEILEPDKNMKVNPDTLKKALKKYEKRKLKIGSFSACSNVTGLIPPYYELAKIMHQNGGYCFVDFAASAPYLKIDMHPKNPQEQLDAIFFSPHKFLGGPGSSGVLIFNKELYKNTSPDQPGGGTVSWTNRWNEYSYVEDIEAREDGGTPGFLQAYRIALSIQLKEQMGCENIHRREKEMIEVIFEKLGKIEGLHILSDNEKDRLGVFSFYVEGVHHNLIVKLLNDRYGIQVRGGCSCAGTYGHFLLHVNHEISRQITCKIDSGDLSDKPGWVRLSIHPTMTDSEIEIILQAIKEVIENAKDWGKDYEYCKHSGEFFHKTFPSKTEKDFVKWFEL
jgi:selenocysteine lyase/cysteine desulfurase